MCRPMPEDAELKFIWTDSNNSDFKYFSDCLEDYFNVLVGGEENRKSFISYNSLEPIKDVIIAYEDKTAIACAGFKKFDEKAAEMKRVWVLPKYRGRHIASELIKRLEERAYKKGYKEMILQTRAVCKDAVNLYKSSGYVQIENYSPYNQMPEAVCYKKSLCDEIVLILPTMEYADDIWKFRQEILDENHEDKFAGCGNLEACSSAKEWIDTINMEKSEKTCPKEKVPSHIFIAIRRSDNKIVGIIDLRHNINTPILSTWGGHMGYYVRRDERRKGYAKEMLRLNFKKCREMGIHKVMITCDEKNVASRNTILSSGGIYERDVDVDGDIIQRYWVSL